MTLIKIISYYVVNCFQNCIFAFSFTTAVGKVLDSRFGKVVIMGVRRIDDMTVTPKSLSLFIVKATNPT